jgi:four helix bundle protein
VVSVELVKSLRSVVEEIGRRDGDLASQARRAAQSIVLNVAEGQRRIGRDRIRHFAIAAGSAGELRGALVIADAWGYVAADAVADSARLLDREIAILYRLVHKRA